MITTVDTGTNTADIQKVLNGLNPGDKVIFSPGNYYLDSDLYLINSGQEDGPIILDGPGAILSGIGTIKIRGDYWNIQNVSFEDFIDDVIKVGNNDIKCSNLIFDRLNFIEKIRGRALALTNISDSVITNCIFDNINTMKPGVGAHAIEPVYVDRIKLTKCVFRNNASDSIQLGGVSRADIGEFLVEECEFYACDENVSWGENAIDIKQITRGPVIIRKNKFTGYRPTHREGAIGHSGGSRGVAITLHVGARNTIIEDNEIYDSTNGIRIADQSDLKDVPPTQDNIVRRNKIFRAIDFAGNEVRPAQRGIGIFLSRLDNTNIIQDNILIDCPNPIEERNSEAMLINNKNLTQDEYDQIGSTDERINALETKLNELEMELNRIGATVEQLVQEGLPIRVQTNETRLNEQHQRIAKIEAALNAMVEVLK